MWIIIAALIIIGLALLIVEIVFIPGTTVVGILGLVFCGAGAMISFRHFGNETGWWVLSGTAAATCVALVYSFKSGAWSKLALKDENKSKVNEGKTEKLKVGDVGTTRSTLRPIGKGEFAGEMYEVRTNGEYVEPNTTIKITVIESTRIFVEPVR